jgi:GT2 family glycosyltransferase
MNLCTAVILGYQNWREYTLPLVQSLQRHWPDLSIVLVDNDSDPPYPEYPGVTRIWSDNSSLSRAINLGVEAAEPSEWYIKFDNDVLCTGPFREYVERFQPSAIYGPQMHKWPRFHFLIGWAFFIPRQIWQAVGGFDERYARWSFDEVDFAYAATQAGYRQVEMPELPFIHYGHGTWNLFDHDRCSKNNKKEFFEKWGLK